MVPGNGSGSPLCVPRDRFTRRHPAARVRVSTADRDHTGDASSDEHAPDPAGHPDPGRRTGSAGYAAISPSRAASAAGPAGSTSPDPSTGAAAVRAAAGAGTRSADPAPRRAGDTPWFPVNDGPTQDPRSGAGLDRLDPEPGKDE